MKVVTVTWLDGKQEDYTADRVYTNDSGTVLQLADDGTFAGRHEVRGIPLSNVRIYLVEVR